MRSWAMPGAGAVPRPEDPIGNLDATGSDSPGGVGGERLGDLMVGSRVGGVKVTKQEGRAVSNTTRPMPLHGAEI